MRISFFGHRDFIGSEAIKDELTLILYNLTNRNEDVEFYFGQYGRFDDFAFGCIREISKYHKIRTVFVTPYITENYQKNTLEYAKHKYDEIIYPEIEKVPYRFAISARNKWMVENSDIIICYINHPSGGAYSAYKLAKRLVKRTINLGRYGK